MNDKEKIYVITKGDYSDYHIITATADKKLAEDIAAKYSSGGHYSERARIEIFDDAKLWCFQRGVSGLIKADP